MPGVDLELLLPPRVSLNATKGEHWAQASRRRRRLRAVLRRALLGAEVPQPIPGGRAHATAELVFPTARRRDEGNYRTELEKVLGDALAPPHHDPEGDLWRWLPDDTPEHFTFGAVTFSVLPGVPALALIRLLWGDGLSPLTPA